MMKVFLTNDDGYEAKGYAALKETAESFADKVTGIAPRGRQSGTSMAVNLADASIPYKTLGGGFAYLDATPASCVKFMLCNTPHKEWPDLIISGINHGSNASTGACYSGTLGAAREGALNGVRSIGVSVDDLSPDADFSAVKSLLPGIVGKLMENYPDGKGIYYNVNFPAMEVSRIKGIKVSFMGMGHWEDEFMDLHRTCPETGGSLYRMSGHYVDDTPEGVESDHHLLSEGYITITPMLVDNTSYEEIRRLEKIFG
ncbi:MAG: hypothetical protein MJY62_04125, partial [Bacteroidales bacterium]|nr:hypothetical protein [Bacteroidales bacterium]